MSTAPDQRKETTWRRLLFVTLVAVAGSAVFFATAAQPFLWTLLLWAVTALSGAANTRGTAPRAILVNLAAVFLVLAAFEGYLWLRDLRADPTRMQGNYTTDYFVEDDLLGYGPARGIVATAEKYHDDQPIYRTRYTIDADGLRVSPPVGPDERGCILFFGGSVTFGEGVADEKPMPYQVGILTAGRYRIYNFAFHGYGPHQMLAALQGGRVDEIISCRPSHVIYQAILPHVERAAGLTAWDKRGPRYLRTTGGGVTLAGRFDDEQTAHPWKGWLNRWLTYDTLFGQRRAAGPDELALYTAILAEVQTFVERNYAGAQFHVLLWDSPELSARDRVLSALQSKGLQLHRMTEILPEYGSDQARYELSRFDHHPTATTHGLIARYVADHILESGTRGDQAAR